MKKFSRVLMYLLILQWILSNQFNTSLQSVQQSRPQTVPGVVEPGAMSPAESEPSTITDGSDAPATGSNGGKP